MLGNGVATGTKDTMIILKITLMALLLVNTVSTEEEDGSIPHCIVVFHTVIMPNKNGVMISGVFG